MLKKIDEIKNYLISLQNEICTSLEQEDGQTTFMTDCWERLEGGSGITRVLEGGPVIEKGGVNFSHVFGDRLPPSATLQRPELAGCHFEALGLSLVIHPRNPYAPTSHANFRFFIAHKKGCEPIWWFGGGMDLTPYYGFSEDCVHWHQTIRNACRPFGEEVYSRYKKECDEYFYLKHRKEPRGIGGIFFDDLNEWGFDACFDFIREIGTHYLTAYRPILALRKNENYGEKQREFQRYRRGRYVEFNLVYDRGTLFGLQSNGRIESILISLPPDVAWHYNYHPEPGTEEARLYSDFLISTDWLLDEKI